jgi:transcriptional regulator with XRE-family HTH domain
MRDAQKSLRWTEHQKPMSLQENPPLSGKRLRISLRYWREQRGLTQEQVAEALEWSASKVVRIELGKVRVSATDVRALLALYQVSDQDEVTRLVGLARVARRRPWYRDYEHALDPDFADYLDYESSATAIETFQQLIVPGLLQTEAYATAMMAANGSTYGAERVQLRLMRQAMLAQEDGPSFECVLDEAALHRHVGGPAVMREQLIRLRDATGPKISVGIIPFTAGAHASMSEPFTLLTLDPAEEDVLFREVTTRTVTDRENADLVAGYRRRFKNLKAMAVEQEQASQLIDAVIHGLSYGAPTGRPS